LKLKCRPEDFRVEERLDLRTRRHGRYSIYRLEKRGWNTLDVMRELRKRHGLRQLGRAGLKDRHSLSVQYLSATGKGPAFVSGKGYHLRLVGMRDEPIRPGMLTGNRFTITLRSLTSDEAKLVAKAFPTVTRDGLPNYYDEQRFGSARHGKGFVAKRLVRGHNNGALRLWLATPSAADDSRTRSRKTNLESVWGDWARCQEYADPEGAPVFRHLLQHPRDYKGAVQRIPREMVELFVNAYQAWLWNETLASVVERSVGATVRRRYLLGSFVFPGAPAAGEVRYLRKLSIPVPGPGARFTSDRVAACMASVLAREGVELGGLKTKVRLNGGRFKPIRRPALVRPIRADHSKPANDEMHSGRLRMTLSFFLPSGSYATLIVKRLMLG